MQRWEPRRTLDGTIVGSVEFDLPIDGEWSDLTAIFTLSEVEGSLVLSLEDLHVL